MSGRPTLSKGVFPHNLLGVNVQTKEGTRVGERPRFHTKLELCLHFPLTGHEWCTVHETIHGFFI